MEDREKVAEYFKRIGLCNEAEAIGDGFSGSDLTQDPSKATLERLCNIIFHHSLSIPFENFNPATGREVKVDIEGVFDKLVMHRRGGYCFEQNTLMNFVLEQLGYSLRRCLGRVLLGPEPSAIAHLVNVVTVDGVQYLVDVGFGGKSPRLPLVLELDTAQIAGTEMYRFQPDVDEYVAPGGLRLQYFDWEGFSRDRDQGAEADIREYWRDQYAFSFAKVWDADIRYSNFAVNFNTVSTNIFTNSRVASLVTRYGRKTVMNGTFTVFKRLATFDFDAMQQLPDLKVVRLPYHKFETPKSVEREHLEGFTIFGGMMAVKAVEVASSDFIEALERELNVDLAAEGISMDSFIPSVLAASQAR